MSEKSRLSKIATALAVVTSLMGIGAGAWKAYDYYYGGPQKFDDWINVNDYSNDDFINFLDRNHGKVVSINSQVDLSIFLPEHGQTLESCNNVDLSGAVDGKGLLDGYVFNRDVVIPTSDDRHENGDCVQYNNIHIIDDRREFADLSYGGSGVITYRLRGFFYVDARHFSGPRIVYYLQLLRGGLHDELLL